jgi:acyl-coenzyme A thioesterase PaaI-like protein
VSADLEEVEEELTDFTTGLVGNKYREDAMAGTAALEHQFTRPMGLGPLRVHNLVLSPHTMALNTPCF